MAGNSKWAWRQGVLTIRDQRIITYAFCILATVRGIDYANGRMTESPVYAIVERVFLHETWGWLFISFAIICALGMFIRQHQMVWLGHAGLFFVYLAMIVGLLQAQLFYVSEFVSGTRAIPLLMFNCVAHAILCLRTGPFPLTESRAQPIEGIAKPEEE